MCHAQHGKGKLCLDVRHSMGAVQKGKMTKSKGRNVVFITLSGWQEDIVDVKR